MELNGEFIKNFVSVSKIEKARSKRDMELKLDLLACNMNTNLNMIEQIFKHNFPTIPTLTFIPTSLPTQFGNTDYITESSYILKGEDEVSNDFKRHVDFLKLLSNTNSLMMKFEDFFEHYFVYWSDFYFDSEYVYPNVSEEAKTQYPNIYLSLNGIGSVIGYKEKNNLCIQSSDKDVWETNAPVDYKFDTNLNVYNLELFNGLSCVTQYTNIQHCPELDKNIYNAINEEYKTKFGFDYNDFIHVNEQFNDFIIRLIKVLVIDNIDLHNKTKLKYDSYNVDLLYTNNVKISLYQDKINILFKFPDSDGNHTNTNRYLEIKIDNPYSSLNEITSKFSTSYQTTRFGIDIHELPEENEVTFYGYQKSNNAVDHYLHYFLEDYKISVLYYGQKLVLEQEEFFDKLNEAITCKINLKLEEQTKDE